MVRRQTSDESGIACGDDFYKKRGCEKMIFIFFTALFIRNHAGRFPAELLTALHFLSFPGKKGNEAKERNRRQGKIRLGSWGAAAQP